jgi:hypothetical protein
MYLFLNFYSLVEKVIQKQTVLKISFYFKIKVTILRLTAVLPYDRAPVWQITVFLGSYQARSFLFLDPLRNLDWLVGIVILP